MPTQANAEHDPQHQSHDLLQSQAVEQIHPEQLLSVVHVFDHQQKKGNQPQTLISQELDALTMNKGFLAKAQKTPVMDDDEKLVLEELRDRSKNIPHKQRNYKYKTTKLRQRAKEYANARFKKAYGKDNFAGNLLKEIKDSVFEYFGYIKEGQLLAVEKIKKGIDDEKATAKYNQNLLMASINILNAFIPIGSKVFAGAIQKLLVTKYLGKNANLNLVTNVRLPEWAKHIDNFGKTAYRSAIVSTIGQIRGLWKGESADWDNNVGAANDTLKELARYGVYHMVLKISQEAEKKPIHLLDPITQSDIQSDIIDAVMSAVFPQLADQNLVATKEGIKSTPIKAFAQQQFLTEAFFYGAKLDNEGEITHKEYKAQGEVSKHALSALQGLNLKSAKDQNQEKEEATPQKKDKYQTIEAITQGPYDLAYQNMRSTLQHMGLDYNFTPDYHRGLRQSNTLGEKNWELSIKITNLKLFRQALNNSFPDWIGGAPGMVFPRHPDAVVMIGKDIERITNEAISPTHSKSGKTYLDFSQTNFGDVWVHTNRQDIFAAKKGNIKDIRSFKLLFAASGPVFTINDLSHAGHKTYGPKNISGKYQLQVIL